MNSDPPWCKYVNEDTECEDNLANEMCPNACRRFEGNYSDAFIFKNCEWIVRNMYVLVKSYTIKFVDIFF